MLPESDLKSVVQLEFELVAPAQEFCSMKGEPVNLQVCRITRLREMRVQSCAAVPGDPAGRLSRNCWPLAVRDRLQQARFLRRLLIFYSCTRRPAGAGTTLPLNQPAMPSLARRWSRCSRRRVGSVRRRGVSITVNAVFGSGTPTRSRWCIENGNGCLHGRRGGRKTSPSRRTQNSCTTQASDSSYNRRLCSAQVPRQGCLKKANDHLRGSP
jgi:hypothetical protein